jgi:hypothetical protein
MNNLKSKLLNILLYPTQLFDKITDKRATLYAGIILVGAIDLLLPDVAAMFKQHFNGKPVSDIYFNTVTAILLIVVLGLIDVIFVSMPLYDFFKFIKKKEETSLTLTSSEEKIVVVPHTATSIKIMKTYIMSHFIIIPVSMILYFIFLKDVTDTSPAWQLNIALVLYMLLYIWMAAIITRGINTLFKFNPIFKKLTFIIVFGWSYLFKMVFDMQILYWLSKIFR